MKVLLVAATAFELAPLSVELGLVMPQTGAHAFVGASSLEVSLLITGIGMVNAAYHLGAAFAQVRPDVAVQIGIAGAYPGGPAIGEVVEVVTECYPELGADSPQGYLSLAQMGFVHFQAGGRDYYNEVAQPRAGLLGLRHCKSLTINRVGGVAESIDARVEGWSPDVESMEGAAFFQACLLAGVPFRQIRAISNRVEPRDRAAWKIPEAITALNQTVLGLLIEASLHRLTL